MQISTDVFSLQLLRDGMVLTEIIRNSSRSFVEKLKNNNLIYIDEGDKVYLTDKGQVARKIGLEKFIELEILEKQLTNVNTEELKLQNKWFLVTMCFLQLILASVLVYIILLG